MEEIKKLKTAEEGFRKEKLVQSPLKITKRIGKMDERNSNDKPDLSHGPKSFNW